MTTKDILNNRIFLDTESCNTLHTWITVDAYETTKRKNNDDDSIDGDETIAQNRYDYGFTLTEECGDHFCASVYDGFAVDSSGKMSLDLSKPDQVRQSATAIIVELTKLIRKIDELEQVEIQDVVIENGE